MLQKDRERLRTFATFGHFKANPVLLMAARTKRPGRCQDSVCSPVSPPSPSLGYCNRVGMCGLWHATHPPVSSDIGRLSYIHTAPSCVSSVVLIVRSHTHTLHEHSTLRLTRMPASVVKIVPGLPVPWPGHKQFRQRKGLENLRAEVTLGPFIWKEKTATSNAVEGSD